MAITQLSDLVKVPNKFNEYLLQRITDKLTLVSKGIAVNDTEMAKLINGTPKGGRFIQTPFYKPLVGEDWTFGEGDENEQVATGVETGSDIATLLVRWHMWGATDLSRALGGTDPLGAIADLAADWWRQKEQGIYIAILKGVLGGALSSHLNDISGEATNNKIGVDATIDTKQLLGDSADSLGMVFMHSATYALLQKNQHITTEYDATLQVNINTYLGYEVAVDDSMPVYTYKVTESGTSGAIAITTDNIAQYQPLCASKLVAGTSYVVAEASKVYDTYFLGRGALRRADGMLMGLQGLETDRDKVKAEDVLIHRRCMAVHPNGFSWKIPTASNGKYPGSGLMFPNNVDLADPSNWTLTTDHKNVPIACLRHRL